MKLGFLNVKFSSLFLQNIPIFGARNFIKYGRRINHIHKYRKVRGHFFDKNSLTSLGHVTIPECVLVSWVFEH